MRLMPLLTLPLLLSACEVAPNPAGTDAPADQVAQIKAINAKRHNAAVDELEAHAARFNEQVKAFKNKGKS